MYIWHYRWQYSGPCDLRPLHLTIPSILRPAISDTILIFSIQISLYFKTTSNLRPKFYGWSGSLKMQGPLYSHTGNTFHEKLFALWDFTIFIQLSELPVHVLGNKITCRHRLHTSKVKHQLLRLASAYVKNFKSPAVVHEWLIRHIKPYFVSIHIFLAYSDLLWPLEPTSSSFRIRLIAMYTWASMTNIRHPQPPNIISKSNWGSMTSSCPGKSQIWNCTKELFDTSRTFSD